MPVPRPDTSITKICGRCHEPKPRSEFHTSTRTYDRLQNVCKSCAINRATEYKNQRGSEYKKHLHLRTRYGISLEQYNEMAEAQQHKCAICGRKIDKLCTDHCKVTETVRGLLCQNCNRGIGIFYHDKEILTGALAYIERTGAVSTRPW